MSARVAFANVLIVASNAHDGVTRHATIATGRAVFLVVESVHGKVAR